VTVNGKRVNIPSYRCKAGDVIQVREKSRNMALVLEAVASNERDFAEYVSVDAKSLSATFVRAPELSEVPYPVKMEPNLVVEFYAS
jgi:small subunit ribosomal protein S4